MPPIRSAERTFDSGPCLGQGSEPCVEEVTSAFSTNTHGNLPGLFPLGEVALGQVWEPGGLEFTSVALPFSGSPWEALELSELHFPLPYKGDDGISWSRGLLWRQDR